VIFLFTTASILAPRPTHSLTEWKGGEGYPGVKRPEREDHCRPFSADDRVRRAILLLINGDRSLLKSVYKLTDRCCPLYLCTYINRILSLGHFSNS
jgi:hypothetical protein